MADDCRLCEHPWGDHVLRTPEQPPTWGWIVCPVDGCDCWFTWSVDGMYTGAEVTERIAQWVEATGEAAGK